jgi:hypothetical protein
VFDFLPANPTSAATAAVLLAGGSVRGKLRERRLKRLPRHRCVLVAPSSFPQVCRGADSVHLACSTVCAPPLLL